MIRTPILIGALLCSGFILIAEEAKVAPPMLTLTGSIQMQAQKAFWDNNAPGTNGNNLDDFWGRANFGAQFKADDFSSNLNIRAFPEGWGFEPLTGLSIKDSTASISKTQIAKFLIEQAWVCYKFNAITQLRLGRYSTTTSKSIVMGNLLDQNAGPSFQGKIAYHNAIDVTVNTGCLSSNVLLGAGDKNLNTGYLRIYESAALLPEKQLNLGAGFKANVFDLAHDSNAIVMPRFAVTGDYEIIKSFKPYFEVGILDTSSKKGESAFIVPFVLGTTIPAGKIFNTLGVEVEVLSGRTAKDSDGKKQDLPLHWNCYVDKKFGTRTRLQAGIYSDGAGSSAGDIRFGLRYTGALK